MGPLPRSAFSSPFFFNKKIKLPKQMEDKWIKIVINWKQCFLPMQIMQSLAKETPEGRGDYTMALSKPETSSCYRDSHLLLCSAVFHCLGTKCVLCNRIPHPLPRTYWFAIHFRANFSLWTLVAVRILLFLHDQVHSLYCCSGEKAGLFFNGLPYPPASWVYLGVWHHVSLETSAFLNCSFHVDSTYPGIPKTEI